LSYTRDLDRPPYKTFASRPKDKNTTRNDRFAPIVFFLSNGCFVHISFPDSPNLTAQFQPFHSIRANRFIQRSGNLADRQIQ